MLLTAAWFALFALPLLLTARDPGRGRRPPRRRLPRRLRTLWAEVKGEWRRDHNIVYYLLASAVFRDGLTGVFAFGAVLGVTVYGVSQANVLLFGICACVVAAIGAVLGGLLDDRVGSKPVIVGSLASMIVVCLALLTLSGPVAFWICGLLLCLFVGPTQSSARTQMLRMSTEGKEGVAFGLYTTTGRAVSFLAPWCSSPSSTCSAPTGQAWAACAGAGGWAWSAMHRGARAAVRALTRQPSALQIVRPDPVRSLNLPCRPRVIEHVISRPTLMMLTLAERSAGLVSWTSLLHGSMTLNSVCSTPPLST